MRILLFGKNGQVGWELQRTLAPLGDVIVFGSHDLDLAEVDQLSAQVQVSRPDVIINAAAYTDVDRAQAEPDRAMAINGRAPGALAKAAQDIGAGLVHYSTDFVFDGTKGIGYAETDPPNPISAYGESKLEGEMAIQKVGGAYWILRTSWVYSLRRSCFVTKVLSWARANTRLRIVTDQIGSPTWCRMLAEATACALAQGSTDIREWVRTHQGIYHVAASGHASRFAWAQAILRHDPNPEDKIAEEILPATSADFPTPATRPANSSLNCDKFEQTFRLRLPPWETSLQLALAV